MFDMNSFLIKYQKKLTEICTRKNLKC